VIRFRLTCLTILTLCAYPVDRLDSATPEALEKSLQANPEDLASREILLGFYYLHPDDAARQSRLRHIAWLIDHHPDSPLLYGAAAALTSDDFKPPHEADLAALVTAWQGQAEKHSDDVRVLENAVRGLRQVEFALTVKCLQRLRQVEPTNPRWVILLASTYVNTVNKADLATRTQADLEVSTDLPLIGIVGQGLYVMGKNAQSHPLEMYGASLLQRAQAMDPLNLRWSATSSENPGLLTERDMWPYGTVPGMSVPGDAVRVAAAVQAAKVIHHEPPQCTPGPQMICPDGKTTLKLAALIGKDGKVKALHASSGDMSTIPLAMDAARQWTYQPTLVKGQQVEVATDIQVAFAPGKPSSPTPPPAAAKTSDPASGVTPPVVLTRVHPEYTPEAHAAKVTGTVKLTLVVDENGLPRDIKVVHPVGYGLDEKAIEAVKKWTFHPATKGGKAVAAPVVIDVDLKQP
jgi:TonB family protein